MCWKLSFFSLSCLFLSACASEQLNRNTLDLASTAGDLQTRQVLYNLGMFIDNPFALPAHLDISAGLASTSYSLNPQISTPFSSASTALSQTIRTVSAAPSTQVENQSTRSSAATSASLTASDAWSQSWAYQPIIDGDELRRLRALYAYALGKISDEEFLEDYPLVRKPQTVVYSNVRADIHDHLFCPDLHFKTDVQLQGQIYVPSKEATKPAQILQFPYLDLKAQSPKPEIEEKAYGGNNIFAGGQVTKSVPATCSEVAIQMQIPDEQFLHEPSCIICLRDRFAIFDGNSKKLRINPRLHYLHGGWLLTEMDDRCCETISLGRFSAHDLYIRAGDQRRLSEFTLFVLTATTQSTIGAAAANAGVQGKGAQGKPTTIALPGASSLTPQFVLPANPAVQ